MKVSDIVTGYGGMSVSSMDMRMQQRMEREMDFEDEGHTLTSFSTCGNIPQNSGPSRLAPQDGLGTEHVVGSTRGAEENPYDVLKFVRMVFLFRSVVLPSLNKLKNKLKIPSAGQAVTTQALPSWSNKQANDANFKKASSRKPCSSLQSEVASVNPKHIQPGDRKRSLPTADTTPIMLSQDSQNGRFDNLFDRFSSSEQSAKVTHKPLSKRNSFPNASQVAPPGTGPLDLSPCSAVNFNSDYPLDLTVNKGEKLLAPETARFSRPTAYATPVPREKREVKVSPVRPHVQGKPVITSRDLSAINSYGTGINAAFPTTRCALASHGHVTLVSRKGLGDKSLHGDKPAMGVVQPLRPCPSDNRRSPATPQDAVIGPKAAAAKAGLEQAMLSIQLAKQMSSIGVTPTPCGSAVSVASGSNFTSASNSPSIGRHSFSDGKSASISHGNHDIVLNVPSYYPRGHTPKSRKSSEEGRHVVENLKATFENLDVPRKSCMEEVVDKNNADVKDVQFRTSLSNHYTNNIPVPSIDICADIPSENERSISQRGIQVDEALTTNKGGDIKAGPQSGNSSVGPNNYRSPPVLTKVMPPTPSKVDLDCIKPGEMSFSSPQMPSLSPYEPLPPGGQQSGSPAKQRLHWSSDSASEVSSKTGFAPPTTLSNGTLALATRCVPNPAKECGSDPGLAKFEHVEQKVPAGDELVMSENDDIRIISSRKCSSVEFEKEVSCGKLNTFSQAGEFRTSSNPARMDCSQTQDKSFAPANEMIYAQSAKARYVMHEANTKQEGHQKESKYDHQREVAASKVASLRANSKQLAAFMPTKNLTYLFESQHIRCVNKSITESPQIKKYFSRYGSRIHKMREESQSTPQKAILESEKGQKKKDLREGFDTPKWRKDMKKYKEKLCRTPPQLVYIPDNEYTPKNEPQCKVVFSGKCSPTQIVRGNWSSASGLSNCWGYSMADVISSKLSKSTDEQDVANFTILKKKRKSKAKKIPENLNSGMPIHIPKVRLPEECFGIEDSSVPGDTSTQVRDSSERENRDNVEHNKLKHGRVEKRKGAKPSIMAPMMRKVAAQMKREREKQSSNNNSTSESAGKATVAVCKLQHKKTLGKRKNASSEQLAILVGRVRDVVTSAPPLKDILKDGNLLLPVWKNPPPVQRETYAIHQKSITPQEGKDIPENTSQDDRLSTKTTPEKGSAQPMREDFNKPRVSSKKKQSKDGTECGTSVTVDKKSKSAPEDASPGHLTSKKSRMLPRWEKDSGAVDHSQGPLLMKKGNAKSRETLLKSSSDNIRHSCSGSSAPSEITKPAAKGLKSTKSQEEQKSHGKEQKSHVTSGNKHIHKAKQSSTKSRASKLSARKPVFMSVAENVKRRKQERLERNGESTSKKTGDSDKKKQGKKASKNKKEDSPGTLAKKNRRSLLDQLSNSAGYIDERQRYKDAGGDLFTDASKLSREERALQRAMAQFYEMEVQQPTTASANKDIKKKQESNTRQKAKKLRAKALQGKGSFFRKTNAVKYRDYQPEVLDTRTRQQASGTPWRPNYHKDSAYEQELQKEEERQTLSRVKRRSLKEVAINPFSGSDLDPFLSDMSGMVEIEVSPLHADLETWDSGNEKKHDTPVSSVHEDTNTPSIAPEKQTKKRKKGSKSKAVMTKKPRMQNFDDSLTSEYDFLSDSAVKLEDSKLSGYEESVLGMPKVEDQLQVPPDVKRLAGSVVRDTGETLLHRAARLLCQNQKYEAVTQWVLENEYCDKNARDNAGYSALHECCVNGNLTIAKLLLAHGADVNISSLDGVRPLHDAVENDHIELVRLLLSCGADSSLATYSGVTIFQMCNSEQIRHFLEDCHSDMDGLKESRRDKSWHFYGSSVLENDTEADCGQNIWANIPADGDSMEECFEFELSDQPQFPTYHMVLDQAKGPKNYILLLDILERMKMEKKDFLKQYPDITVHPMSLQTFTKSINSMSLSVHCKWLGDDSQKNAAGFELVEYTENIREIIGVDIVHINSPLCKARQSRSQHNVNDGHSNEHLNDKNRRHWGLGDSSCSPMVSAQCHKKGGIKGGVSAVEYPVKQEPVEVEDITCLETIEQTDGVNKKTNNHESIGVKKPHVYMKTPGVASVDLNAKKFTRYIIQNSQVDKQPHTRTKMLGIVGQPVISEQFHKPQLKISKHPNPHYGATTKSISGKDIPYSEVFSKLSSQASSGHTANNSQPRTTHTVMGKPIHPQVQHLRPSSAYPLGKLTQPPSPTNQNLQSRARSHSAGDLAVAPGPRSYADKFPPPSQGRELSLSSSNQLKQQQRNMPIPWLHIYDHNGVRIQPPMPHFSVNSAGQSSIPVPVQTNDPDHKSNQHVTRSPVNHGHVESEAHTSIGKKDIYYDQRSHMTAMKHFSAYPLAQHSRHFVPMQQHFVPLQQTMAGPQLQLTSPVKAHTSQVDIAPILDLRVRPSVSESVRGLEENGALDLRASHHRNPLPRGTSEQSYGSLVAVPPSFGHYSYPASLPVSTAPYPHHVPMPPSVGSYGHTAAQTYGYGSTIIPPSHILPNLPNGGFDAEYVSNYLRLNQKL